LFSNKNKDGGGGNNSVTRFKLNPQPFFVNAKAFYTEGPNRSGDDMEAWWIGGAAGVEWLNVSTPGRRHIGSKSWRRGGAMDQNRDGSERWRHGGVLDLDASR
jgi:hypothetical protein